MLLLNVLLYYYIYILKKYFLYVQIGEISPAIYFFEIDIFSSLAVFIFIILLLSRLTAFNGISRDYDSA